MLELLKAHAYGNDFLLLDEAEARGDLPALARATCDRHTGIGADGLIVYRRTVEGAAMRLFNADGSYSEVSGNGVRCLGAALAGQRELDAPETAGAAVPDARLRIDTDAGPKLLTLLAQHGIRYTFRAAMGAPADLRQITLDAGGQPLTVVALRVGNPQCIVLGEPVTERRLHELGPLLTRHPAFPEGTNVELAEVERPDRVRILIWERGVGPTEASGTGACGSAVAAAAFGGASRDVEVVSPGGTQRVEWLDDGIYLTGWAEVVAAIGWLR